LFGLLETAEMTNEKLRRLLKTDLYDGAPWTDGDIDDLKMAIERGRSIDEIAEFLCRSGSAGEVRRKAAELGLNAVE
jgi:hypothetical protein